MTNTAAAVAIWRCNVKIVVTADMLILVTYLLTIYHSLYDDNYEDIKKSELYMMNSVIGSLLSLIVILITFLQAEVAFRMSEASDMRRIPAAYAKLASFWRNISIVFIGVAVIGCVVVPNWIGPCIIIWRLIGIYVVNLYIKNQLRSLGSESEFSSVIFNTQNEGMDDPGPN